MVIIFLKSKTKTYNQTKTKPKNKIQFRQNKIYKMLSNDKILIKHKL